MIKQENQFITLIGNKLDQEDESRQVEFERASDFAQNNEIMFSEVSSLKRKKIEMVLRMIKNKCSAYLDNEKNPNLEDEILPTVLSGQSSSVTTNALQDSALNENRIIA